MNTASITGWVRGQSEAASEPETENGYTPTMGTGRRLRHCITRFPNGVS